MGNLRIMQLPLGMLATNCYLAVNEETGALVIVDPGAEASRVMDSIGRLQAKPEAILLTHGHFDHIGAAAVLREQYGIPVCAMEGEQEILEDAKKNLSGLYGRGYTVKADRLFRDQETVALAGVQIEVLHTPGHTVGGCCYYIAEEKVLFSGDTLFQCSVGRTDFPTGSMGRLHESIHTKLFVLPEETVVYPGHGETTGIGYEKRYNPY